MPLHSNYSIRWKNYKSYEDTGWIELRPLTVLIGSNNSGKSNLISPWLLLNQTMSSRDSITPLVTRGPMVDAGTFSNFVHLGDTERDIFLGLRFHVHEPKEEIEAVGEYPPGAAEITLGAGDKVDDIMVRRYALFDIYKRTFLQMVRNPSGTYGVRNIPRGDMYKSERLAIRRCQPVNFLFSPAATLHELVNRSRSDREIDLVTFSEQFSKYVSAIGFSFEELRRILRDISYIGPLRDRLKRHYDISSETPASVGSRGEHTANLLRRRFPEMRRELNSWLRRFEFGDSLEIQESTDGVFSLSIKKSRSNYLTNVADIGFGASQVLPLITQALAAERDSLTIAEQPEIHLNPRLQAVLADLLATMAKTEHRVVVETHSEHLLLRLRRLVAKGELDHNIVSIYFIEKQGDVSRIRNIPLRENGHIESREWPKGFFEDSLRESIGLANEQAVRRERLGR